MILIANPNLTKKEKKEVSRKRLELLKELDSE